MGYERLGLERLSEELKPRLFVSKRVHGAIAKARARRISLPGVAAMTDGSEPHKPTAFTATLYETTDPT